MTALFYSTFKSSINPYTIVWVEDASGVRLKHIFLTGPQENSERKAFNSYEQLELGFSQLIIELNEKIMEFLGGKDVKFQLDLLDFSKCSNFQKSVLIAEFGIPRGYVSTYKKIAAQLGKPNAARAVGNALAQNPFPLLIPCHRAIKSNGELGGFQGGTPMKKKLLELEGIKISEKGRILMNKVYY